jgi:APA family basic amino acid/polyamine antiporter
VFGLPSVIGGRLGAASPWAWVAAALGMALVVASFAEVASRFTRAGGTYLYARVAFGRFAGIEMAWLTYLVRLTAAATNANLFVIYLAEFWPRATEPVESRLLLALVLLPLAAANYRGVRGGVSASNGFAVAKLVPLAVFVVVGLFAMGTGDGMQVSPPPGQADAGTWLEAILLLVFAYGGFESALLPLGEAKDPRRDAPVALFAALGLCALLYTLVQVVVIAALADPAASPRPLAAAAHVFLGPLGAWLMAAGALVSVYGYLAAAMLNVPRLTYAMAAEGDLPPKLGAVHPKFRTPHVSVMLFAAMVWTFAAAGNFLQNLTLSAVSRLLTYGAVSVALVVLRRKESARSDGVEPAWLRVPAGHAVAALGLGFSAVLALRMSQREIAVLAGTLAAGLLHWMWMRGRWGVGSDSSAAGIRT